MIPEQLFKQKIQMIRKIIISALFAILIVANVQAQKSEKKKNANYIAYGDVVFGGAVTEMGANLHTGGIGLLLNRDKAFQIGFGTGIGAGDVAVMEDKSDNPYADFPDPRANTFVLDIYGTLRYNINPIYISLDVGYCNGNADRYITKANEIIEYNTLGFYARPNIGVYISTNQSYKLFVSCGVTLNQTHFEEVTEVRYKTSSSNIVVPSDTKISPNNFISPKISFGLIF